jgi:hypothetical protein
MNIWEDAKPRAKKEARFSWLKDWIAAVIDSDFVQMLLVMVGVIGGVIALILALVAICYYFNQATVTVNIDGKPVYTGINACVSIDPTPVEGTRVTIGRGFLCLHTSRVYFSKNVEVK